jgi:hypothetical protein
MYLIPNIIFGFILIVGIGFFIKNINKLKRNIKLGTEVSLSGPKKQRWINMVKIALGQSKMVRRPISGVLHIIVYIGFVIINIELLEIIIDGLFGTHRIFSSLGPIYGFLIGAFEILAVLVLASVIIFWLRRNIVKIKRFLNNEMKGWPKTDANLIIYFEIVLMVLFLTMNAADVEFQSMNSGNLISGFIAPLFQGFPLNIIEQKSHF